MKRKTILTHLFMLLLLPSGLFPVTETVSDKGSGGSTLVLDIERAVGMAVSNSFELKEIMAREEVYDLVIDENFREYFPSVTFSYMQTDEVRIRAADSRQAKISVNGEFVLLDGGRRSLNYNVAKLNALVAGNDYRIALGRLIVQVRTAFLNLLRLKDSITIYRMTLDMGNMQLGFIRRECELGDATRLAVMEIEARISEIELSLKEAIDSYESDLKQFKLLLRIDWRIPVLIQGDLNSDFIFILPTELMRTK